MVSLKEVLFRKQAKLAAPEQIQKVTDVLRNCFEVLKDKFVSLNASLFALVLLSASLVVMTNTIVEKPSGRLGRTKCTDQMNCDLLNCMKKALVSD